MKVCFFINFSPFKPDTENNANFDAVSSKRSNKFSIKYLYECNGYNAGQFITKFLNKGWMKNSINRMLVKFGTVDSRPGSSRRSARTDDNVDTVESLLQSQEDKTSEQPNSQNNFTWGVDPSISVSWLRSASQVLQEKTRPTADWSAQHACVMFGMQFERR